VTEGLDVVRQLQKGDRMEKVEITEAAAS
jgi:hypothetical protein